MASLFNAKNIIEEYGRYYIDEGQNKKRLVRALVQPPVTLELNSKHIRTSETKYRLANYTFGNLVKPFKATFEPSSNIEFYPNEIDLRKMKINVEITPDEIEEGWLGFLGGDSTRTKKDWPIVRWLMEEYLAKQIGVDRELNMVYKGKYNANGTTPADCMDGIKELLIKGASASYPINVISGVGALNKDQIFDQIEKFDEKLPALYTNIKVVIFMSPSWVRLYKKDKRSQGFYFIDDVSKLDESVMFTKHVICPLPSMEGTDDIFATVPDNLLWLTKREGNLAQADLQMHDYNLHILLDWWEGIGFACNQMVWTTAETVGASAVDTASPEDGIEVRHIYPVADAASDVAATAATLTGRVVGEELPANAVVKFAYGTTEALGTETAATASSGKFTASISSLTAETTYYYRVEVTIGTDKYVSDIETFETAASGD